VPAGRRKFEQQQQQQLLLLLHGCGSMAAAA
jgi:hypothetical protein